MAQEYELKQVKVRLKLAEAEPLYSTEQITTPDKAAAVMSDALAQMDREYCCVVNLDAANHPINFNVVSIGDISRAQVSMQNVFKSAILSNAAGIMLFHNHPSGSLKASMEDLEVTKRLVEAGKIMNIPVLDHIIVAGGTAKSFSLRAHIPDLFAVWDEAEYCLHDPQAALDPDRLMVRPAYGRFGVYEMTGENSARILYEGAEQDCYDRIGELRERYRENRRDGDSFTIYQLKDDESLHYIRFEGLDRLERENQAVDKDNYDEVYKAALKQGTTLDDIYFQFNALRPLDFRGHSLSVSDVVVLHRGDEDKAFYVDIVGFTEIPDFLLKKTAMREVEAEGSWQEIVEGFRSETDRLFHSEKVDGMRPADIEEAVRGLVQQMIDDYGLDAAVEDVVVSGSRCRGLEDDKSDLDVVVSFSGSEGEDELFNILHDEKLFFGSIEQDINPINTEQTGTLAEYLPGVEKYLSEKKAAIGRDFRESAPVYMENPCQRGAFFTETGGIGQFPDGREIETLGPSVQKSEKESVEKRKEPKQEETNHVEEHKKNRKRVSMKQKLMEKKAEIAGKDGRFPEAGKLNRPKGMGVDD